VELSVCAEVEEALWECVVWWNRKVWWYRKPKSGCFHLARLCAEFMCCSLCAALAANMSISAGGSGETNVANGAMH
jgi:hypothetical protein